MNVLWLRMGPVGTSPAQNIHFQTIALAACYIVLDLIQGREGPNSAHARSRGTSWPHPAGNSQ